MDLTLIHTCVPLLVMLSGSLLLGKVESYSNSLANVLPGYNSMDYLDKYFYPYYSNLPANYSPVNLVFVFHQIFVPFFWFIILVCALYLITPALRLFVQKAKMKDIFFVVLLWFVAVCVLPYIRNTQAFPRHGDNGIVRLVIDFIGYFLLGFLIIKIPFKKNIYL